tara:strand:+ start:614 stop:865 length:252 start_codon:yes stop_codon:yes gene_type:complete
MYSGLLGLLAVSSCGLGLYGKEAFLSKNLRNDKSKRPFIKEIEKHFPNTSHAEFIRFNVVKTHDYKNHLHAKHPILSYWIILQ